MTSTFYNLSHIINNIGGSMESDIQQMLCYVYKCITCGVSGGVELNRYHHWLKISLSLYAIWKIYLPLILKYTTNDVIKATREEYGRNVI